MNTRINTSSEEDFLEYCIEKNLDINLLFGYVMANIDYLKNIQDVYFKTKKLNAKRDE